MKSLPDFVKSFAKIAAKPITTDIAWWIISTLLLGVTACYGENGHFSKVSLFLGLLQAAGISYLISTLIILLKYKLLLRWFFICIAATVCFVDLFCILHLGTRFDSNLAGIVVQTDSREIDEFIDMYVLTYKTLISFIIPSILCVAYGMLRGRCLNLNFRVAIYIIPLFVPLFFIALAFPFINRCSCQFKEFRCATVQYYTSFKDVMSHSDELAELTNTLYTFEVRSARPQPEYIIMVIGESYNKHHSSLYGYRLNTTPNLNQEYDNGNLFVFKDVISPYPGTSDVMHDVLSVHTPNDSLAWSKRPLLPAVLKKAGYEVSLFDNQASRTKSGGMDYSCKYFLNPSAIDRICFDFRTEDRYKYDNEMARQIENHEFSQDKPHFIIVHLSGQHMVAKNRIPSNYGVFTTDSYPDSIALDMRCDIAAYDNATLFNDEVLKSIIERFREKEAVLVYFSDHGEEIHDFRRQYGRTLGKITPDIAKNIYEVPFMIWCSDSYIKNNPEKTEEIISSVNRKFYNSDVSRLILDLSGVEGDFFRQEESPISPDFKETKRVLYGGYEYDK